MGHLSRAMDISVVLCTYNNAERLRITLQSFCRLNQPEGLDWELVVVNNNSTDDTETVIKSFDGRLPITYVYEPEQGLSRARNTGLDVAEGELIVFTDDDVKPNPDWLTAYWEAYQDRPEENYFGGPVESEYEEEPPDGELLEIAMPSVVGLDYGPESGKLDSEDIFIGANWACPSVHLRRVGGFDESFGLNASTGSVNVGEETELMSRLEDAGLCGWYVSKAKLKHFVPKTKCKIGHICSRRVAPEFEKGINEKKVKSIFRIPLGLYKGYLLSLLEYVMSVGRGKKLIKSRLRLERWKKRIEIYTN